MTCKFFMCIVCHIQIFHDYLILFIYFIKLEKCKKKGILWLCQECQGCAKLAIKYPGIMLNKFKVSLFQANFSLSNLKPLVVRSYI